MPAVNLINGTDKRSSGGFTTELSLGNFYLQKPHVMEDIIHSFGQKFFVGWITKGMGKTYGTVNSKAPLKLPETEMIGANTCRWGLMGYKARIIKVLSYPSNNGVNSQMFTVVLEDGTYFSPGDIIAFPGGGYDILGRIYGPPQSSGMNRWTYQVQLLDINKFLIPALMPGGGNPAIPNYSVAKRHSIYGEDSRTGYSVQFMPEFYENYMTIVRKSGGITGDAASSVTWLGMPGATKKTKGDKIWWTTQEQQLMEQLWEAEEFAAIWGEKTVTPDGKSAYLFDENGKPIWAGDGILRQLDFSIQRPYIVGQTDRDYWDELMNELIRRSDTWESKKYIMLAGMGMCNEFRRAMKTELISYGNAATIFSDVNGNDITYNSGNIQTIRGLWNNEISLVHHGLFDHDGYFGHDRHPRTGLPMMSYMGIILDVTNYGGYPNLAHLVKGNSILNRGFIRTEEPGLFNIEGKPMPFGTGRDSTQVHLFSQGMYIIRSPYSSAVLRASVA